VCLFSCVFFFSSRRRHTRFSRDWSSDVCSSDLILWMFPLYFTQFITSPISMALHVTNNQKLALCFQSVGVLLRCGGIFLIVNWKIGRASCRKECRFGEGGYRYRR